jgi:hypothetical protein
MPNYDGRRGAERWSLMESEGVLSPYSEAKHGARQHSSACKPTDMAA